MTNITRTESIGSGLPASELAEWKRRFAMADYEGCKTIASMLTQLQPRTAKAWHLKGLTLVFAGTPTEGLKALQFAVQLGPDDAAIRDSLGVALGRIGEYWQARTAFRSALQLASGSASIWINTAQNSLSCGLADESMRMAQMAISLAPTLPEGHLVLANALYRLDRHTEALSAVDRSLALNPLLASAHLTRGSILQHLGRLREAVAANLKATELDPNQSAPHVNLGLLYSSLGEPEQALQSARAAVKLDINALSAWSNLLYCLLHDEHTSPSDVFAAHQAFGDHLGALPDKHSELLSADRQPARPLRLGFVSGDLCDHPVARFIEPIWTGLDRSKFSVHAYMTRAGNDDVSERLRSKADTWHQVANTSDDNLLALIRSHQIDVLFDLSGHTAGNRLMVFARRAAPLQVSWIGYPGTTGLATMDYRFVDATMAPPGRSEHLFTEHLVRLPYASVFQHPGDLPPIEAAPCVNNGYPTFGSFNRANKINAGTISLWARLMRARPDAKLLIGAVPDTTAEGQILNAFSVAGVAPERLRLLPRLPLAKYIALHHDVDLALDTYPFSSGTTANFALWMGVPTMTLAGEAMVSRLCASRLAAAGLPEFITESPDQFIATALDWADRPAALSALRRALRPRLETLQRIQASQLIDSLENALLDMWRQYCASKGG